MSDVAQAAAGSKNETNQKIGWTSEYYDALVRRLQAGGIGLTDVEPQAIGVTSCQSREGVTTVASNLAIAAAKVAKGPVLLVDANVRQPAVNRVFRVKAKRGLVDALSGEHPVFSLMKDSRIANLSLLSSGKRKKNERPPSYAPSVIRDLFDNLKDVFNIIVVDLPPAQPLTTCLSMASCLDGVLLVIAANKVRRDVAVRTRRQLSEVNADVLGVVYNKA